MTHFGRIVDMSTVATLCGAVGIVTRRLDTTTCPDCLDRLPVAEIARLEKQAKLNAVMAAEAGRLSALWMQFFPALKLLQGSEDIAYRRGRLAGTHGLRALALRLAIDALKKSTI